MTLEAFKRMQLEAISSEETHIFLHVNLLPPGTGYEVCLAHLEFFLPHKEWKLLIKSNYRYKQQALYFLPELIM